ncbi:MAG: DNA mismatch repair protein [Thelocarpon superellum]|nr:MAG: DNA mismatch repair protein [Thelocarpon superellum]
MTSQALDQDVVNKIAAGEIIVAPVHALKELMENAVDAGSTSLEILVKDGGLKLLQITDNGHGIEREDLPILCERFTTSKLKTFEDLTSIGTYGFRGEALASISHIAHLTVTTKTTGSSSKPGQSSDPKATAGRGGTQITVEDLFYNVPTRRRAFRSASEEYAKILDMVGRYAVHCAGVAFSCKKHGESSTGISVPGHATTIDRIRQVHGSTVANELVTFDLADDRLGFKVTGMASNANYHVKRTTMLLFINHRAVESSAMKKAVEQCYATFLPKGGHPFVYLSLDIEPERVDVNVHPTKREVNFLNEDDIIDMLCNEIRTKLADVDTSRTFMTQSLLPGVKVPTAPETPGNINGSPFGAVSTRKSTQRPYENNLVRTDSKSRKITSMLPQLDPPRRGGEMSEIRPIEEPEYEYIDKEPVLCRLTTVKELRAEVRENTHNELTEVFATHSFVGVVDETRRLVAMQGGVKLYLVDYGMVCKEYFYQVGLTDFGNFGRICFDPPLSLRALLEIAIKHEQNPTATVDPDQMDTTASAKDTMDWSSVASKVEGQLMRQREMLDEYFSLSISAAGTLDGIPLLLKGYLPSLAKLPRFLLRLGPAVDWSMEKKCFQDFLRELADFYVPERLPPPPPPPPSSAVPPTTAPAAGGEEEEEEELAIGARDEAAGGKGEEALATRRAQVQASLEHALFPAFKAKLVATRTLATSGAVVEVANLKGLYRVFERC